MSKTSGAADEIPSEIFDRVNSVILQAAAKELTPDAQEQLSRLQNLIDWYGPSDIEPQHGNAFLIAATALAGAKPNIVLAQSLLWDLEFILIQRKGGLPSRALAKLTGGWPMVTVGIGMATAIILMVVFWAVFVFSWSANTLPQVFVDGGGALLTTMFFGTVGACISILTRIERPADLQKLNPISLFLNCLFKPLVGATFAAIIFFLLQLNIIGGAILKGAEGKLLFLFSVIGFVTGFSERVATDAIAGAERALITKR